MAPMAGVTDRQFRALVWEHGAGLTFSEMVSAKSIVYGNKKTYLLMENSGHIRPWAIQFFGHEPQILSEAIKKLEDSPFDIVNINMGCPMPKIVNNGEGAALMRSPKLVSEMVIAAVKASSRPVTVKIRLGFTRQEMNAVHIAHVAAESGAEQVIVHGRTRDQYYTGEADWDEIVKVKESSKIPVIGNGDIYTPEVAVERLKLVDGIMIARGAYGNPWIFSRTLKFLETGVLPKEPTQDEIIGTALKHMQDFLDGGGHVVQMRKHLTWYTKGFVGSAEARKKINNAQSADEMETILRNLNKKGDLNEQKISSRTLPVTCCNNIVGRR